VTGVQTCALPISQVNPVGTTVTPFVASQWTYTNFIEAQNEKGDTSAGIAIGAYSGKADAGDVAIIVSNGTTQKAITFGRRDTTGNGTVDTLAITPQDDNSVNLGDANLRWKNGYFKNLDVDTGITTGGDISSTGVTAGNIQVGITGDNEIDTTSGNLTLDSAGGTVIEDDILQVTGAASAASLTLTTDLAVAHGGTGLSSFTGNAITATNAGGTALSFLTSSLGTVGDIVQFNASGVPVVSNIIDGGTY
jgi:hypothetical protein